MSRPLFFLLVRILILIPGSVFAHATGKHVADHDDMNTRSRALTLVKIGCLVIIFVLTFVAGVSPYFLKWSEGFLVLGTQFAGGVFLGTALMHFLSDANETFEDLVKSSSPTSYPFAFMLASAGYLLTMLSDCVLAHVFNKNHLRHRHSDLEFQGEMQTKRNHNDSSIPSVQASSISVTDSHSSSQTATAATTTSLGDTILLITALCFHSVFEGIAIGVSETESDAWRALWTITLHKIFAAIAMGIALLRMIPDRPFLSSLAYSFAFAISSPVGVAIGIVIDATTHRSVADWIFAVSMSLACGVFVYVSINHLLAKGYLPNKNVSMDEPRYKFAAVSLGVGVIAIVMMWDT